MLLPLPQPQTQPSLVLLLVREALSRPQTSDLRHLVLTVASREGRTLIPLPRTLFQATFYFYLVQEKLEAQTEWVSVGRYGENKATEGPSSKSCSAQSFLWASVSPSVK